MTTDQRSRVWIWALGGLATVLAVVLVVVLLTRDNGSDTAATTTTTAPVTTAAQATTTTGATTTTNPGPTTTTIALPVVTSDPQTYAQYLLAAWQNNDHTAAATVASADAVTQMFSQPYPAVGPYTFSNCGPAAGSLYCTWNGQHGATIQMTVRTLTGGLPVQVEQVLFSP